MSSLVAIYDCFLSKKITNKIENELNHLNKEDYPKIKSLLNWLPKEIIKEKNVIKYAEIVSGIEFSYLSKEIRANVAIKNGLNSSDTQIHFDNRVFLNIVVPIFMKDLKDSGLIIFPYFSSLLLRPFLRYKLTSKIIRKSKIIRFLLNVNYIKYESNKGYIFKGNKLAHGVFYNPLSQESLRAVLTINFKRY